jgi:DNA-binding MarR family transcriptional regulator
MPRATPTTSNHPDEVADLRRGTMHLARRLRVARGPGALNSSKLSLLGHLSRRGPMTPGQLAAAESLRPQSLTRLLAELEDEGNVVRHPDQADRRQYLVTVTERGLDALARDVATRDAWLAGAMTGLTQAECDILAVAGRLMELLADGHDLLDPDESSGKPEPTPPAGGGA